MEKNILNKKTCGWKNLSSKEKDEIFNFSDGYISFLNECKTERETSKYIIEKLKSNGFVDINNDVTVSICTGKGYDVLCIDGRAYGVWHWSLSCLCL